MKRLYLDYFPPFAMTKGPGGKTGVILCVKTEEQCDPFDFNFLDKELIFLAKIAGSGQKYVKMILRRMKIHESVYAESEYYEETDDVSSNSSGKPA